MIDLFSFVCRKTAQGLSLGKVYMASKKRYTLVGSREGGHFSVMLLRGHDPIYHQNYLKPVEAAAKMVEVWWLLTEKLRKGQPTRPYTRR